MLGSNDLSKLQIDVLAEYVDLLQNHYVEQLSTFNKHFWYIRLKHLTKSDVITLFWEPTSYTIKHNGKVVKYVASDK